MSVHQNVLASIVTGCSDGEHRFYVTAQFACHLSSCARCFLTPKARRLHLIQAHGYPKEYFFAVTNKGVGGLLKRWGEGASLLRGQWKARESRAESDGSGSDEEPGADADDSEEEAPRGEKRQAQPVVKKEMGSDQNAVKNTQTMDSLTDSLGSLALVPPSVRFGRGTKRGGFSHQDSGPSHQQKAAGMDRGRLSGYPTVDTSGRDTAAGTNGGQTVSENITRAGMAPATGDEVRPGFVGNGRGHARGLPRGLPPPRGGAIRMQVNFAMARGRGGIRGTMIGPGRGFMGAGRGRGGFGGMGIKGGAL